MLFMEKFQEIGAKIAAQRHMSAIRDGVLSSLPATLAGSLFLLIRFLPIPGWSGFLESILGPNYQIILSYPIAATYDIIGIIVLLGISYRLSLSYKVDPFAGSIIALCGYFTLTPSFTMLNIEELNKSLEISGVWSLQYTGSQSLFVVIICAIITTEIYRKVVQKNLIIKLPNMVPPAVSNNFMAIVPTFLVLLVMFITRIIISFTPFETIHNLVNITIQTPLTKIGGSFFGYATLIFFKDLLWTIGIHGPTAIGPILEPIEYIFRDANRAAAEGGYSLPHIFTYSFRMLFTQIGGSGNTFMLTIMCAFLAKSEKLRSIGKLSLGPSFFQINEPIIFGIPIVLNPIMIIPFILSSFTGVLVGYLGMVSGLVAKLPGINIPWTTPTLFNAYIASAGKISVVMTQIIIIILTVLIYYPFFMIVDKQAFLEEQELNNK